VLRRTIQVRGSNRSHLRPTLFTHLRGNSKALQLGFGSTNGRSRMPVSTPTDAGEPLEYGAHFHSVRPSESRRGSRLLFKDSPERPVEAHSLRSPRVVKIGKSIEIRSEQVSERPKTIPIYIYPKYSENSKNAEYGKRGCQCCDGGSEQIAHHALLHQRYPNAQQSGNTSHVQRGLRTGTGKAETLLRSRAIGLQVAATLLPRSRPLQADPTQGDPK